MNQDTLKDMLALARFDYRWSRWSRNFKSLEKERILIWSLEKQIKTKPRWKHFNDGVSLSYCRCQEFERNYFVNAVAHCPHCGQAMDWEEPYEN